MNSTISGFGHWDLGLQNKITETDKKQSTQWKICLLFQNFQPLFYQLIKIQVEAFLCQSFLGTVENPFWMKHKYCVNSIHVLFMKILGFTTVTS